MAKANEAKLELTAVDQATPVINAVGRSVTQLRGAYIALGAAVASGVAFTGFIQQSIATRAALDDLADTTGDNVKTLDGLRRVARISGMDLEALSSPLAKLAKNLNSADDDGKAAGAAIKAIGLNIEDIRSKKPGEAMFEIAKALGNFEDGASKVAVAMALFGREGAKMLPFLKDLSEQSELHGKITAEQAAQAEQLEKQWRMLQGAFKGGKEELASGVIPVLLQFVEQMREGIRISGGLLESLRLFGLGMNPFQTPAQQIQGLNAELDALNKKMEVGPGARWAGFGASRGAALAGQAGEIKKQIEFAKFMQRQEALQLTGPQYMDARDLAAARKPTLDFTIPSKAGAGSQADPYADLLKRIATEGTNIETERNFYSEIVTLLNTDKKLRSELTVEQRNIVKAAAAEVEQKKNLKALQEDDKQAKMEAARFEQEVVRLTLEQAGAYKDMLDPTRALFREWEKIDTLQRQGVLSEKEALEVRRLAADKVMQAANAQHVYTAEVEGYKNAWRDLGFTASSSLEELIVKVGKLSDVLRAAGQDFSRIMFRRSIGDPLAKWTENFSTRLFGGNNNVTTSAKFNEAIDLQGFATGGQFFVGGAGGTDSQLVAFRATPGERVSVETPSQQKGRSGGTFYIDARNADREGLMRLEAAIRRLDGQMEHRAVAAVFNANLRGIRV